MIEQSLSQPPSLGARGGGLGGEDWLQLPRVSFSSSGCTTSRHLPHNAFGSQTGRNLRSISKLLNLFLNLNTASSPVLSLGNDTGKSLFR